MPITLSFFGGLYDTQPTPVTLDSFAELAVELGGHQYPSKRTDVPLFSPVVYREGTTRANANVEAVTLAVLDFDDTPLTAFEEHLEGLMSGGAEFLVYSTWSHAKALELSKVRARVLRPFTAPVAPKDWPAVWSSIYQGTNKLADAQCSDPARMYFIPSCPAKDKDQAIFHYNPGNPLDVTIYQGFVVPKALLPKPSFQYDDIGVTDLQRMLVVLNRGKTPYKVWLHEKTKLLLAGESLAEPGTRDKTVWDMVCGILDFFPRANPRQLLKLFAPSLQSMELEAPGAPTVELLLEKVNRQQEKTAEKKALAVAEIAMDRSRHISQAFGLSGRDTPYTGEELAGFVRMLGLPSLEYLKAHWIIQRVDSYYILCDGQYKGPFHWSELTKAAQIYLSPAYTAGVETQTTTARGTLEPKSGSDLVAEYGTIAANTHISLFAQRACFDPKTGIITEAPTPLRFTEPRHDPEIEQWLILLGGETADKLFDWLSVVTRIEEPCAALYLEGMGGVGKSLLAEGVSSLWSVRGPTSLVDAMAGFNDTITKCPLLFADESVPSDFRGKARTGELRQLIQARTRELRRKFLPTAVVWGACRLILAANNADLINTSEHLTVNDIEAIVDRFVHIDATNALEAKQFLAGLPKATLEYWVKEGIARYCLWLAQNHQFNDRHRFLVSGDRTTLHRRLTVSSGIRSAVCCWLVGYLLEPRKYDVTGALLVRVHKGRLLVNVRALQTSWGLYDTSEKIPSVADMAKAVKGISDKATIQLTDGNRNRTHYHVVDTGNLISWAEEFGFATKEVILQALETDTKEPVRKKG